MTQFKVRSAVIALFLFAGTAICGAQTVTIGPTGNYASMCAAAPHLTNGETITIDANGGTPYSEHDCLIAASNLTISGINGRPIIDGTGLDTSKGLWVINGHDIVINNVEFRNSTDSVDDTSADALRVQAGTTTTPNGGNLTIENSYITGNDQGFLDTNTGTDPATGTNEGQWYSSSPYITFQYDEFAYNGVSGASIDAYGNAGHNFYIGRDWNEEMTFTLQYTWAHDDQYGIVAKDRAPISNIYYNLLSDYWGQSSQILDVPNGGSTYVVGNVLFKNAVIPSASDYANAVFFMEYREDSQTETESVYSSAHEDLHVVNNTAIMNSDVGPGTDVAFVIEECPKQANQANCPAPYYGPPLTVPGVFENNIFFGYPTEVTTDQAAYTAGEIAYLSTQPTDANMAPLHFANPDALDYHITSGSQAIGYGIYPPTNNMGTTDMTAYANYQYAPPMLQGAARPTPGGSTMDAGAFSYPPTTTPSLSLNISPTTVTVPGTGTITVSGLPTPPAGSFNYAVPISTNSQVLIAQSGVSSTGSVIMPYQTLTGTTSPTVVPVNVYADGGIVSGNITVNPGPPVPYSITLDTAYKPFTTVHLEGPAGAGGQVVDLSSSDSAIAYVPATVTVPAGQSSAETGSLTGSSWGTTPTHQSATITATVGSTSAQGTFPFYTFYLTNFECSAPSTNPCASIQGGTTYQVYATTYGTVAPYGGVTIAITSSNPAVVPNQSYVIAQGTDPLAGGNYIPVTTNTVTSNQTVTVTASYNGVVLTTNSFTVTPGNPAANISIPTNGNNNQSANVGTEFAKDMSVVVTDSSGNPVQGVPVTFTPGAGVSIIYSGGSGTCTPPQTTTGFGGGACFDAEPTASGALTVQASAAGVSTPVTFNLTGVGGTPASVTAYSGSGQSSNVGTAFPNPLVAIVKDSSGNPLSGITVTFSGTGLSFSPTSAVTSSGGLASTTATPTTTGSLTADGTVSGVGTLATFAETGTSPVAISSITSDGPYWATTTVNLTAAAPTGGAVVTLSSSNSSIAYVPASVTVPSGSTSAETGSLLGSLWGQTPSYQYATITGTYNGTANLTKKFYQPYIAGFPCASSCSVTGGDSIEMNPSISQPGAPYGGASITVTSSNTAVIPNQSIPFNAGQTRSVDGGDYPLTTNTVGTATNVTLTATFNGTTKTATITVNP